MTVAADPDIYTHKYNKASKLSILGVAWLHLVARGCIAPSFTRWGSRWGAGYVSQNQVLLSEMNST
jgi:hypothetical protein